MSNKYKRTPGLQNDRDERQPSHEISSFPSLDIDPPKENPYHVGIGRSKRSTKKQSQKEGQEQQSSNNLGEAKGLENPNVDHNAHIGRFQMNKNTGYGNGELSFNDEGGSDGSHDPSSRLKPNFLTKINCQWEWFKKLEKKKKIALIASVSFVIVSLITLAIVLPLVLVGTPQPPQGVDQSPLEKDGNIFFVNAQQVNKGKHVATVHASGRNKIELTYPTLDSITKMIQNYKNESEILFSIPVFSILENFGNGQKQQQAYKNWLVDYNADPRKTLNTLYKMIRDKMARTGTEKWGNKIADNMTLTNLQEVMYIDILFTPGEEKFSAAVFDPEFEDKATIDFEKVENIRKWNSMKKQKEAKKEVKKEEAKTDQTQTDQAVTPVKADGQKKQKKTDDASSNEKLMSRVMEQTIYYIKRAAARSVELLRSKSAELLEYQKKLVSDSQVDPEWQTVLLEGCKTVEALRFRCTLEAAMKLDTDLTMEKIQSGATEYVITQSLNLTFKEVKVATE